MFVPKYCHKKLLKPKSFQKNQETSKQIVLMPAIQRGINLRALQSNECQITEKNNKAQGMNFGKGTQIVQNVSCYININKRYFCLMH